MSDSVKHLLEHFDEKITNLEQENARLREQLYDANNVITHVVYESKNSTDMAYRYLLENGLKKEG